MLLSASLRYKAWFRAIFRLSPLLLLILFSTWTFARPSIQSIVRRPLVAREAAEPLNVERLRELEEAFSVLEKNRKSDESNAIKSLAFTMVDEYLRAGHLQEALWVLQRSGYNSEAQHLEDQIKETMLKEKPDRIDSIYGSKPSWWSFKNGVQALAKAGEADWARSVEYEVFAYALDKFLGLNRIPVTVATLGPDGRPYSLQLRLKSSSISRISFRDDRYLSKVDELSEVYIFDYLTGQTDRHNLNSLRTITGRLALIDNARAMGQKGHQHKMAPPPSEYFKTGIKLENHLMKRISNVTQAELFEHFGEILTAGEIEILYSRILELRTYFSDPQSISCQKLLSL